MGHPKAVVDSGSCRDLGHLDVACESPPGLGLPHPRPGASFATEEEEQQSLSARLAPEWEGGRR